MAGLIAKNGDRTGPATTDIGSTGGPLPGGLLSASSWMLLADPVYPRLAARTRSGSADVGRPQVLVNRLLGDPERTPDPYGL